MICRKSPNQECFVQEMLQVKYPRDIFWRLIFVFTCAGLCHAWISLLGAQVLTHHLLEGAHEHRDEAVDVAGIVATGRLQNHQSP